MTDPRADSFIAFFNSATGGFTPYYWQLQVAVDGLPDILPVPTGLGKTEVALVWAWRLLVDKQPEPLHLVVCLPMRSLVRQTVQRLKTCFDALKVTNPEIDVGVHQLMGGAIEDEWVRQSDKPWVLVGTQDQLLSRALNRECIGPYEAADIERARKLVNVFAPLSQHRSFAEVIADPGKECSKEIGQALQPKPSPLPRAFKRSYAFPRLERFRPSTFAKSGASSVPSSTSDRCAGYLPSRPPSPPIATGSSKSCVGSRQPGRDDLELWLLRSRGLASPLHAVSVSPVGAWRDRRIRRRSSRASVSPPSWGRMHAELQEKGRDDV